MNKTVTTLIAAVTAATIALPLDITSEHGPADAEKTTAYLWRRSCKARSNIGHAVVFPAEAQVEGERSAYFPVILGKDGNLVLDLVPVLAL